MLDNDEALFAVISVVISGGFFLFVRYILGRKLAELKGTPKLLGLISIIIISFELVYLATLFDLFRVAADLIASIGVAFALVSFALQNHLKNMISGIGLYLNPQIDIGDIIEIEGRKGVITDFHLMRTIALTEDGQRIIIPNLKFSESVTIISHKNRKPER